VSVVLVCVVEVPVPVGREVWKWPARQRLGHFHMLAMPVSEGFAPRIYTQRTFSPRQSIRATIDTVLASYDMCFCR